MKIKAVCGLMAGAGLLISSLASAHKGHDEALRIALDGTEATLQYSLDTRELAAFDSNHDGRLSVREYRRQAPVIAEWIDRRLVLIDSDGGIMPASFSDHPITGFHALADDDVVRKIRVIRRYQLSGDASALRLKFALPAANQHAVHYAIFAGQAVRRGRLATPAEQLLQVR